ncbi:MAG: GIY-YIG nuclease family protein [Desulfobulbus sp.]|nr:GIY-YIG nuclease family protein [Desulfobulbus sp.]
MRRDRFIYFMQNGEKGPIKIGITFDVQRRLAQAQTFNYQPITLLGEIPGDQRLETALLNRFSSYHLSGEWFAFNDELYNLARGIFDVEYDKHGERNYLVLYRQRTMAKTDPCPFCLAPHNHGDGDGHRVAHCLPQHGRTSIVTIDGTVLHRDHGYIIKSRDSNGPAPKAPKYNRVSRARLRTFANLLTFATNKFIESNIFSLDPVTIPPKGGVEFLVKYPDGTPCKIGCNDAGYGEVGINVLYGIKRDNPPMYTFVSRQSKEICSAHATGWLERSAGKYLQIPAKSTSIELYCERHVCNKLSELEIRPIADSFGKQGPFHF